MTTSWRTRLRATVGNAITWGLAWSSLGAVLGGLGIVLSGFAMDAFREAAFFTVAFGFWGAVGGALVSPVIGLVWRGRRLQEISRWRFGLTAAALCGGVMPLIMQGLNVLSGDGPIPWRLVLDDAPLFAVLGGAAATASLIVAQRARAAASRGTEPEQLDAGAAERALPAARWTGGTADRAPRRQSDSSPDVVSRS